MTATQTLELLVAIGMIGFAVWHYVRRGREGEKRGSQGAVFLGIVGILVAMHALGAFQYRPSQAEIEAQSLAPMPEPGQ